MKERIITALIMIAVVIGILFIAPALFTPFVAIVLGIAIWEWCRIAKIRSIQAYAVAAATIILWILGSVSLLVFNALLILSALHYLYAVHLIRQYEKIDNYRINKSYLYFVGPVILSALATTLVYVFNYSASATADDALSLLFIILVIAAADSGAYFIGKWLGEHKLSPKVSPKKTVEGFLGGLISVVIVVYVFQFMVEGWYLPLLGLLIISLITALYSVIGDLFISIIKRQNHVKDSSQILPGHGGILDRIDGQLAGIPIFYFLIQFLY